MRAHSDRRRRLMLFGTRLHCNPALACGVWLKDKRLTVCESGYSGLEPWISDGTSGGTAQLRDLNSGGDSSEFFPLKYILMLLTRREGVCAKPPLGFRPFYPVRFGVISRY